MVEWFDDCVADGFFNLQLDSRALEEHDRNTDGWLNLVVVPVAGGVIALSEEFGVLLIGETRCMKSMSCSELVLLLEEDGV